MFVINLMHNLASKWHVFKYGPRLKHCVACCVACLVWDGSREAVGRENDENFGSIQWAWCDYRGTSLTKKQSPPPAATKKP